MESENKESNTAKGQTFENATVLMLSQLNNYFGIESIESGKPGHIKQRGESGTVFKLDVLAYNDKGRKLIFSCKDTQSKPATEAIGGLYLTCEELDGEGFLVTRENLSDNMSKVASAKEIRVLVFQPNEKGEWNLKEQINEVMTNYFFAGTETVSVADSWKIVCDET